MGAPNEIKAKLSYEVEAKLSYHLAKIAEEFKSETRVTLVVRPPLHKVEGDTDLVLTDEDDLNLAIAVLERSKLRDNKARQ